MVLSILDLSTPCRMIRTIWKRMPRNISSILRIKSKSHGFKHGEYGRLERTSWPQWADTSSVVCDVRERALLYKMMCGFCRNRRRSFLNVGHWLGSSKEQYYSGLMVRLEDRPETEIWLSLSCYCGGVWQLLESVFAYRQICDVSVV